MNETVDRELRYGLWIALGVAILLAIFSSGLKAETAAVQGNLFVPVAPCRISDSRFDGAGAFAQGEFRYPKLTGICGIPEGVVAVSVNIAVANSHGGQNNGVLKVGLPVTTQSFQVQCQDQPCEAWVNWTIPYVTQANNSGTAVVDSNGRVVIGLFQGGGTSDVVIDTNGYFVAGVQAVSLIAGTASCSTTGSPSWSKCVTTISDPRVKAGMIFATTYNTRQADDQIPVRIFNVVNGAFSAEIQGGTTFSWHAVAP